MSLFCVTFGQRYRLDPHPASPLIHPDGWDAAVVAFHRSLAEAVSA